MLISPGPNRDNRISIVVPMCNEEDSIDLLREKLAVLQDRLGLDFELEFCLVDDGSTDATWEQMGSAVPNKAGFIRLRHEMNRGVGAAIRTGIQASSGSIVCTIDADCSYPPQDLYALVQLVVSGDADVAVASPYHPQGGVVGVRPWRIFLSRQCSNLYQWLSPLKLHTYTSIFRAYSGEAARQLTFASDGFVSAAEILFRADRNGYCVREVPLILHARQRGYSKIRIVRTICAHLGLMLQLIRASLVGDGQAEVPHPSRILNKPKHTSSIAMPARLGEEDSPVR